MRTMRNLVLTTLSLVFALALFPLAGLASGTQPISMLPVSDRPVEDDTEDNAGGEAEENKTTAPADTTEATDTTDTAAPNATNASENGASARTLAQNIIYLDENSNERTCPEATEVEADTREWTSGWYVVDGNVEFTGYPVSVNGDVHLILTDRCSLDLKFGIWVTQGNSLTIYAQSESQSEAGSLTAKGWRGAGIGGKFDSVNCGNVTINGGVITATADNSSAAIGGGKNGSCGNITINGGFVTANAAGSDGSYVVGAAIGSSGRAEEGNVTITGGVVEAIGSGSNAAAIGGGSYQPGKGKINTLTISGGHVIADGGVAGTRKGPGISGYRTFSTGTDGHAFIETSSITVAFWSGKSALVAVDGNVTVYGDQVLRENLALAGGKRLTLDRHSTLTIPAGVTLESDGILSTPADTTIVNNGAIVNNGVISNSGGIIKGTGTLTGIKADAPKPSAPTAKSVSAGSILLEPVIDPGYGGVEYACVSDGATPASWQSDPLFEGLDPATDYIFYARYAGNAFYSGAASDGAAIATANYRVSYVDAGGTQLRTPADVNVVKLTPAMIDGVGSDGTLAGGWYVVEEDMIIEHRINIRGEVHLILADGIDLNCRDGIAVEAGNSFTVYGQTDDSDDAGVLRAKGSGSDAAIGGSSGYDAGDITFESGVVMARGVASPAIGGGVGASLGSITINGGFVQAMVQAERVCALGGCAGTTGGTIQVHGGTVEAYSKDAPAMGATNASGDVSISISGGALRLAAPEADAVIGVRDSGSANLVMTGGLIYGFGNAKAMTNCSSASLAGGTMVFCPADENGRDVTTLDELQLSTPEPATVYNAAIPDGLNVPAGTLVVESDGSSSYPASVTLPSQGQATFTSTKGDLVTITSTAARAGLRFKVEDNQGNIFLPAGFTVKIGNGNEITSPEKGMWLRTDGTVESTDDNPSNPSDGSDDNTSGDNPSDGNNNSNSDPNDNSSSNIAPDDSNANSTKTNGDERGSVLVDTNDGVPFAILTLMSFTLLAGVAALRFASIASSPKRGKHVRK